MSKFKNALLSALAPGWQHTPKDSELRYKVVSASRAELEDMDKFITDRDVLKQMHAAKRAVGNKTKVVSEKESA